MTQLTRRSPEGQRAYALGVDAGMSVAVHLLGAFPEAQQIVQHFQEVQAKMLASVLARADEACCADPSACLSMSAACMERRMAVVRAPATSAQTVLGQIDLDTPPATWTPAQLALLETFLSYVLREAAARKAADPEGPAVATIAAQAVVRAIQDPPPGETPEQAAEAAVARVAGGSA